MLQFKDIIFIVWDVKFIIFLILNPFFIYIKLNTKIAEKSLESITPRTTQPRFNQLRENGKPSKELSKSEWGLVQNDENKVLTLEHQK